MLVFPEPRGRFTRMQSSYRPAWATTYSIPKAATTKTPPTMPLYKIIFNFYLFGGGDVSWHTCGGQRTACQSRGFASTMSSGAGI